MLSAGSARNPASAVVTPAGTTAQPKPSRAASESLRSMPLTLRTSPASPTSPLVKEQPRRVGNPVNAVGVQQEAADLVGGAEAVLHAAHHAKRRVAVALEVQHDVDEVLQRARPCDGAVIGDVADQQHRHPGCL